MQENPKVSIILCSLNRKESLKKCLDSIKEQTFKDYEIILCEEEGRLVELKDKGWRKAKGEIIAFCDDDIVADRFWLENITRIFDTREDVVGVTGSTFVPKEYLKNRDVFKNGLFKVFYNWFFLEGRAFEPGKITKCGVNTYGANFPSPLSARVHEVDFLEPSQFAVRRSVMVEVEGFDLGYEGVGEWCDVDLCYRIKKYGGLIYHPQIKVFHYPTCDSTTNKRLETASRYRNYCRWADKFVKPSFKNKLYRLFLKTYFFLKERRLV